MPMLALSSLFLLVQLGFLAPQQDAISIKTFSILNQGYLVADSWSKLPVQSVGEDVNSKVYGGIYYPPVDYYSGKPVDKTTIAAGYMEIQLDLENMTSKTFLLEKVNLSVKKKYALKDIPHKSSEWDIGSRGSSYNPYFEIDGSSLEYSDVPQEFFLKPKGQPQDKRITIEVETYTDDKDIYQFHLSFVFVNTSDKNDKVVVKSDKAYFIAVQ